VLFNQWRSEGVRTPIGVPKLFYLIEASKCAILHKRPKKISGEGHRPTPFRKSWVRHCLVTQQHTILLPPWTTHLQCIYNFIAVLSPIPRHHSFELYIIDRLVAIMLTAISIGLRTAREFWLKGQATNAFVPLNIRQNNVTLHHLAPISKWLLHLLA
jgi:hypothetical protein